MRVMRLVAVVLACGLAEGGILAPTPDDPNQFAGLGGYLRYAERHNAGVRAAYQKYIAAAEMIPQAKALPDPMFEFEMDTRVDTEDQTFALRQTFPWFGVTEARGAAASAEAKAALREYEAARLALFNRVKRAFYEYAYLGQAVAIARQNLELLLHFEEVARVRYATSAGGHPDVIRAQIEMAMLQEKVRELETMRGPVTAELNAAMNRPSESALPWPRSQEYAPRAFSRAELVARLTARNPELKAMEAMVEAAQRRAELARKRFYPEFGLGVEWMRTDGMTPSMMGGSGEDPIVAMFSVTIPLWQDSYSAGERQARAQAREARERRVELENELASRAAQALYEYEDSARKAVLYRDTLIPKGKEMLEVAEGAYRAGTADFLTLLDAQRTLLQFEVEYRRAVADNFQALAEIEMLAGGENGGGTEAALAGGAVAKDRP